MAPSLTDFHNPTPESVRAEVAAWMWLLEYESAYSALPPERRPALGDGWLATLCVSGMLIQHVESKKVYLSLGNETWMAHDYRVNAPSLMEARSQLRRKIFEEAFAMRTSCFA